MSDMYFEPGTSISRLIQCIHNPEERVKWDKDVEYAKNLEVSENGKALIVS